MPRQAFEEMIAATAGVLPDIVSDARKQSQSQAKANSTSPRTLPSDNGWREAAPLGPYSGERYISAQIDAQDRVDRAERERKFAALPKAEG